MNSLKKKIEALPDHVFMRGDISIHPIRDDSDLWYATVECQLAPGQDEFVNPAGFSIGRAYLNPEDNIPCIIRKNQIRIGYIVLREWHDGSAASWSYYLDRNHQGLGYGKKAAGLAVFILKSADPGRPIKLSTESANMKAQNLYKSVGFRLSDEMDGSDLVFIHE